VVEDNAVNRMMIVTYLDEFGLTYEVVSSGGAAVMSLASKDYDLVLMDNCHVQSRRRRDHAAYPQHACAHFEGADRGSPRARQDSRLRAYLAAGMDAYVTKPIRGRELYAVLAPLLGGSKEEPILRLVKG
jgi:CheY-like chemotaxis protein